MDRAAPGEADEVLYYHTDVNGAPEEMTDGGGNIVWEAGYQVWGNLTHEKETRPVQQNLRFQGQYLDRETGLHYNLYRFYDPDIGKFISGDPISIRGGINLYQYAPNPISWIDPLGLASTNNPGVYDVYGEARLPSDMYRMSDGKHFQEANRQLYYQMKNDPQFKATLEGKYPGIFEKVSPGKRGAFPRKAPTGIGWETTWHHHERVGGLLQLVDGPDHNSRHLDYHPKGYGGRKTWGGGSGCR
ncbi:RHS domain-containing protein [Salmonella enterica]|uniref:Rhs-family protein n=2 Tax=Salmonella enterica TaxID=28901 RepID=A0A749AYE8_SALER|nr:Rhs-family protein [Salmonella enterica]EBC9645021.1 Rhs-family protein [Salmonella enterica subsp. enterica serovar Corvallis]EDQ4687161.1 Rhs-family protein [Salmonella enterica subsp. enterica serovar Stanleyville]EIO5961850.1 RHS domain-containing protein [Salmonella enterica subsp. enterica serovar Rubislaw]EIY9616826.1 RHS domain-containing protein [Salmonella enterica subsp. enterica]